MEESALPTQKLVELGIKPAKSWLKILGFSALGLLLAGGLVFAGYKLGQNSKLKEQSSKLQLKTQNLTPTRTPVVIVAPTLQPETTPSPHETANWKTYTNTKYGFEIKYPPGWTQESETHIFQEGDIFSMSIVGKTQKPQTEFYDGARLTIGMPIETNQDIKSWVADYYPARNVNDEPNEFSEQTVGLLTFQKVYTCGLGCFSYYNIKRGNYVYRLMLFAAGQNEALHKETLQTMLSTFRFLD